MKIGFDNQKYLEMQSQHIRDRIAKFGDKLYLEFGGKLFDDYHASRVLPGFKPDSKLQMLMQLKDEAEIVIVINADDIEKNKVRGDLGITYDLDVLRLIDVFRTRGLCVNSVVLTRFADQPATLKFEKRLIENGINVYHHYSIPNYPTDIDLIVSEDGFGKNDFVATTRPLVVVSAPGPGSATPRRASCPPPSTASRACSSSAWRKCSRDNRLSARLKKVNRSPNDAYVPRGRLCHADRFR